MLVIRFLRVGKKNQPSFKIVITDKRWSARAGRFVVEVGFWNPLKKEKVLKPERIKYWLSVGAKPSPTVFNLLISEKIIEGKKIPVHKKAKKFEEDKSSSRPSPSKEGSEKGEKPAPEKPAEEKPVPEEKPTEEKPKEEEKPAKKKPKEEVPKTE